MPRKKKEPTEESEVIDISELVEAIDERFNAIETALSQTQVKGKSLLGFELVEERDDLNGIKYFHYIPIDKALQEFSVSKNYLTYCKNCGVPIPEKKEMNYFSW